MDNDDLLREILLRLPSQPSSLLRASAVCKRWRGLVSDPGFLRRFRAHHRKPPLLGCFSFEKGFGYDFAPMPDRPDRIPRARFSLPHGCRDKSSLFVECRHGLALLLNKKHPEAVVWSPISGHQRRVALPPEFGNARERGVLYAAVLCAAGDDDPGHVHGGCDLTSFKLALVSLVEQARSSTCLYESKSGLWGNVVSTTTELWLRMSTFWRKPSVLVGNSLFWLPCPVPEGDIIEFDLEMQKLVAIEKPADCHHVSYYQIIRTEKGSLGLVVLRKLTMRVWERKVNSDDVATWVLQKTVELANHLRPRHICPRRWSVKLIWARPQGYDEDHNVIFLRTSIGCFTVQLDLMQFDNRFGSKFISAYFPYTSFCSADWAIGGRDDGPEISSSTTPNCLNR